MEPKEKALELITNHLKSKNAIMILIKEKVANNIAKNSALITVNQMIEESLDNLSVDRNKYWKKVKIELEKL